MSIILQILFIRITYVDIRPKMCILQAQKTKQLTKSSDSMERKALLSMLLIVVTMTAFAQRLLSPAEVEKLLREQEMGKTTLSPEVTPVVEETAKEVLVNNPKEKWGKKDLLNLLRLSSVCSIPSLKEVTSIARYNSSPKVSQEANEIFEDLQMKFLSEAEIPMMRKLIEDELLSVNHAPWPVSKSLWENYRYWVVPSDIKKLFEAATNSQIFSSYMFDLAAMTAIDLYSNEGCSVEYQNMLILIQQAHKYEPRLSEKALKKIQNNIKN